MKKIEFGEYKGEAITWLVLEEENGKALMLSEKALDVVKYNEELEDTTWEKCTLRRWLNTDFVLEAFGNYRNNVCLSKVVAAESWDFPTYPGKDTYDKVCILSMQELDKYWDEINCCKVSKYVKEVLDLSDEEANCCWWIRTPGQDGEFVMRMDDSGWSNEYGIDVNEENIAVRPALWLDLNYMNNDKFAGYHRKGGYNEEKFFSIKYNNSLLENILTKYHYSSNKFNDFANIEFLAEIVPNYSGVTTLDELVDTLISVLVAFGSGDDGLEKELNEEKENIKNGFETIDGTSLETTDESLHKYGVSEGYDFKMTDGKYKCIYRTVVGGW